MNINNTTIRCIFILVISLFHANLAAIEVREITWDNLIPEGWNPTRVFEEMSDEEFNAIPDDRYEEMLAKVQAELDAAPVIEALDGKQVRIPGFIVPLEIDITRVTEFLLVPYFGACTHTPPPPANQIIFSKVKGSYTIDDLYDPVWVTGKLIISRATSQLNEAGVSNSMDIYSAYSIEVDEVELYE